MSEKRESGSDGRPKPGELARTMLKAVVQTTDLLSPWDKTWVLSVALALSVAKLDKETRDDIISELPTLCDGLAKMAAAQEEADKETKQ